MTLLYVTCLITLTGCLVFLLWRWGCSPHRTLSQHAAAQRASIIYYGVLFLIFNPLFALYFYGYFIPELRLSFGFSLAMAIILITQVGAGLIPEVSGWRRTVHRQLAAISVSAIVVSTALMLAASLAPFAWYTTLIILLAQLATAAVVIMANNEPRHILAIQASFYASYLLLILLIDLTSIPLS